MRITKRPCLPRAVDCGQGSWASLAARVLPITRDDPSLVTVRTEAPAPRPYGYLDGQAKEILKMHSYLVVIAIIAVLIGLLLPAVQ